MLNYDIIMKIMPLPIKAMADKSITTKRGRKITQISEITITRVLMCLPIDEDVTSDWIALTMKLHPGTVSRAITALIKRKAIKRTKRDKVNYISLIGVDNAK